MAQMNCGKVSANRAGNCGDPRGYRSPVCLLFFLFSIRVYEVTHGHRSDQE